MRVRWLAFVGMVAAVACFAIAPSERAVALESSCAQVTWQAVASDCAWTFGEYQQSSSSGDGHTWVVTIQCGNGGICSEHVECVEGEAEGFVHDVYMDGTDVGDVCVPEDEIDEVNITQLIIREFRRIDWPSSNLVVQPKGGRTLVNFDTNFYTPDHRAIDQDRVIANTSVTIRAVPTSYTYYFGDGENTTTASPGSPHPDLDITHMYLRTGEVEVSLATTYAGEYRIGDGEWVAIEGTLTVEGEAQGLEVVEAIPQLVLE